MKDNCTEMVFILDRSGSMQALNDDTIGGFNSMIEQQKKVEGEAYVTTVLFDDRIERLHKRVPLAAVKPLTDKKCFARGSTALCSIRAESSAARRVCSRQDRLIRRTVCGSSARATSTLSMPTAMS